MRSILSPYNDTPDPGQPTALYQPHGANEPPPPLWCISTSEVKGGNTLRHASNPNIILQSPLQRREEGHCHLGSIVGVEAAQCTQSSKDKVIEWEGVEIATATA